MDSTSRGSDLPPAFDEVTAASFVVADWSDPGDRPGAPIAPLHVHHEDDEAWLVLEGRLGFRVGDVELEAGPGESVVVRPGQPHSYWNARPEPARYLLVMTPRIRALIDALHAGDRADVGELFREHASELLE